MKLVFIIPRGEVLRNFVYSGILAQLKEQYELHLISIVPNDTLKDELTELADEFHVLEEKKLSYGHGYLIDLLDLAHNRYLWSEAAKVRWNMRDVEAKGIAAKVKRTANKLFARALATDKRLRALENYILKKASGEPAVQYYQDLLEKIQPDLVFNGSHVHSKNAYPIVQAARILGIRTGTFLFSWDNLTSQGRVLPPYDRYLAWNTAIKEDLLRIYPSLQPKQVHITGTPQFTFHFNPDFHEDKATFLKRIGLASHERYVLYSSGMSHHMPYETEVAELLADILKDIDPNLRLVIRTYAKDRADVFEELKERRKDIIIPEVRWEKNHQTPLQEDQYFFTNLLRHCELGVNVASTISLELCMLDKPAINIGFNPPNRDIYPYDYTRFYNFDHYKPIVDSGAVTVASSPENLREVLLQYLEHPAINQENRRKLIEHFFDIKQGTIAAHFESVSQNVIAAMSS